MHLLNGSLKKFILSLIITCSSGLTAFCQNNIVDAGAQPKLFLQEGVATPNNESVSTFTPDGNTVYLADGQTILFFQKDPMVNGPNQP